MGDTVATTENDVKRIGSTTLREYLASNPGLMIGSHYGDITAGELAHGCMLSAMDEPVRLILLASGTRHEIVVSVSDGDWHWQEYPDTKKG